MNSKNQRNNDLELEKQIEENINKHGWYVVLINETNYLPSFGYTIGLWKNYQHPELICIGLKPETIHLLLNIAGEKVKNGETIRENFEYNDFLENYSTKFLKIEKSFLNDYFGYAIWFYKKNNFDAMQLVWPNEKNLFPWEINLLESQNFSQPLLDRNSDFKFLESRNTAIFTSRNVLTKDKPIVYVSHNEDGSWEFYSEKELLEDNIKVLSIYEIVKMDLSLNEVFNLDYGQYAERKNPGAPWIRYSMNK